MLANLLTLDVLDLVIFSSDLQNWGEIGICYTQVVHLWSLGDASGSPGQGNYSAANMALDAHARYWKVHGTG